MNRVEEGAKEGVYTSTPFGQPVLTHRELPAGTSQLEFVQLVPLSHIVQATNENQISFHQFFNRNLCIISSLFSNRMNLMFLAQISNKIALFLKRV